MVQLLKSSFGQLLNENTWMDSTTKKYAKEKLLAIKPNVAAPDIVFDIKLEKDSKQVSFIQIHFIFYIYSLYFYLLVW